VNLMAGEVKRCLKCGWIGDKAKLSLCSSCETTYYQCPVCGGKTEIIPTIS
jgi:hypothetical protein